MKHPLRNTVLSIAGSLAIAALFLASASSARAAGVGEPRLDSRLGQPLEAECLPQPVAATALPGK